MARTRLKGADARLLKGYAPLVGLIVFYALIVLLTPTVAREEVKTPTNTGARPGTVTPGGSTVTGPGASVPGGGGTGGGGSGGGSGDGGGGGGVVPAGGVPCADGRTQQIPGDTYSPVCIDWPQGQDNGGNTYRGVSADKIRIGYRLTNDNLYALLNQIDPTGSKLPRESLDDVKRTADVLLRYMNDHFQFYGRKMEFVPFTGDGLLVNELLGQGAGPADTDAAKAEQLELFGDASALTQPYAEALAGRQIMAFGAAYMSSDWFQERRPYVWSIAPDCTSVVQLNAAALSSGIGKPTQYSGPEFKGKPRKVAFIAPSNQVYQQCADQAMKLIADRGLPTPLRLSYTLDVSNAGKNADDLLDQLQANDITTVLLGVDPILLFNLTEKAASSNRNYFPEWAVLGVALTDTDLAGQLMNQSEWSHAYGVSLLGEQLDRHETAGYQAYRSVDPNSEPSIAVDIIYYQLYMIALGIQLAGPQLTPDNFEAGMFGYQGGFGLAGSWKFGPGDYTGQDDGVYVYWDPNATSAYNGAKGKYIAVGQRFTKDTAPAEIPPMFAGGG